MRTLFQGIIQPPGEGAVTGWEERRQKREVPWSLCCRSEAQGSSVGGQTQGRARMASKVWRVLATCIHVMQSS